MPDFNFPYNSTELSEQVNRIPNQYGLLQALGLFRKQTSSFTVVEIRIEDGVLRVLPAKERGAPATENKRGTGKTLFFKIPHFPLMDTILPQDIQDMLRMQGRSKTPETVDTKMAERLLSIRNNHAVTLEYIRSGALKGLIKDGDGTTLYNLFTEFGINKKEVDFVLGTGSTDIIAKCEEVNDHIVTNLKGEVSNGVEILVSSGFFNKFIQHAKVEKHWLNWQAASEVANMNRDRSGGNWGRTFRFQNIFFREDKTTFPVKVNGELTSVPSVAAGYGHAFPTGTMSTFETWFGPANTMSAANQPGDEIFISPKELDHDKGVELWSESNTLSVCKRPEVLVEVRTSN
jgi:hypothetical protein